MGKLVYIISTDEFENKDFLIRLQDEYDWQLNNGELVALENIEDEDILAMIEPILPKEDNDVAKQQVYIRVCW